MQIYFSHICDGTDVQADWRRSCTYGRAPNAIDISHDSLTCPTYTDTGPPFLYGDSDTPPHLVAFYDTLGIRRTYSGPPPLGGTNMRVYWVFWCFASHATIFQSYNWRHRCAGGLKKLYMYLRSGSQRHRHFAGFLNVPVLHRHATTLFIRWFRHIAPFSRLLRHPGDTENVRGMDNYSRGTRGECDPHHCFSLFVSHCSLYSRQWKQDIKQKYVIIIHVCFPRTI